MTIRAWRQQGKYFVAISHPSGELSEVCSFIDWHDADAYLESLCNIYRWPIVFASEEGAGVRKNVSKIVDRLLLAKQLFQLRTLPRFAGGCSAASNRLDCSCMR